MAFFATAFALVVLACARTGDGRREPPPPNPLVGEWNLAVAEPVSQSPGLRVSLAIDSGTADAFHGHISLFFSGNVGIDPAALAPFRGTVTTDGLIRIPVRPARPDGPELYLEGRLARDTIRITRFTIGPDTFTTEAGRLLLVRNP